MEDALGKAMTFADLEESFTGQIAELKKYLDFQFEQQTRQMISVLGDSKIKRPSRGSPFDDSVTSSAFGSPTRHPGLQVPSGGGHRQVSGDSARSASPGLPRQISVEEPRRILQHSETSDVQASTATAKFAQRRTSTFSTRSRRKTFVRANMLERQLQARRAVTKPVSQYPTSHGPATCRGRVADVVLSPIFNYSIMALIIVNAALMGIEIDVAAQVGQNDIPTWFSTVNKLVVVIFVVETALKLLAMGCKDFFKGPDALWNCFDVLIVSLSVAESMAAWVSQSISVNTPKGAHSVRILRTLRLARMFRSFRITRLFRYFSALRSLILSIMATWGSLMWTLLLLLILWYVFSIIFTEMVIDHCRRLTINATNDPNAVPECPELLALYWSNVIDSMHTLFMAITGGIDWSVAYEPLKPVSPMAIALMNLYVVIGFFTLLNVITGVFVNQAIESASADKELAALKQAQNRLSQVNQLTDIFQEFEGDGALNITDVEAALESDRLSAFMESMGISTDDVWTLFMLIDDDGSGFVEMEEFVSGCMQLRGPAKSMQIAKMSYENKLTRQWIKNIMDRVEEVKHMVEDKAMPSTSRPKRPQKQNSQVESYIL